MKQVLSEKRQRVTFASLLVALGIIYGDIGTSPLYALRAVVGERQISNTLVYGGVSAIFWTLVIQTSIKYIWLTLKADNQGEGGIFSLYAVVKRYGKHLGIFAMIGATTLLADGIITPPISVASAVEGLGQVKGLEHLFVAGNSITIGTVMIILSLLFFFQRFGTQRIGKLFGPVMLIWFSMLFSAGLISILGNPTILEALNPVYAFHLLAKYPSGFWLLGAVFLCTTGAEALYSDLGHCGIRNIRISWILVKTCLVVNYLGQAAWIIQEDGGFLNNRNPFYEIIPGWFLIPAIVIATAATIIASQALISGSYTLISEAMNLNFWPRVAIRQPTETKGQVYIPSINNLLWFGCLLMILYFRSSEHMEAAYGFSITITMIMTTILLSYFLRFRLKWNKLLITGILLVFGTVELSFFLANAAKIKERWMFLFFELLIFLVMYTWFNARKIKNKQTSFLDLGKYAGLITELSNDKEIPKTATHLIYLSKSNKRTEIEDKIIQSIFSRKPKRADVYWFVHINRTDHPYTLEYDVTELVKDTLIKINLHIGFRIQPKTEMYFKQIVQELVENKELNLHILPDGSTKYHTNPDFQFIVIEKFLSAEYAFSIRDNLLLKGHLLLKYFGLSDQKAFGLDRSDVIVEHIPMTYHRTYIEKLKRNHHYEK